MHTPTTIALIMLALGCGSKPASEREDETTTQEPGTEHLAPKLVVAADRAFAALVKLGNDFEASGGDCAKATEAVKAASETVRPFKDDTDALQDALANDPAARAWFEQRHVSEMVAAATKVQATAQNCISDKAFAAAWEANLLMTRKKKLVK